MTIHLKIQLRGINNPPVWRKIVIPGNFTFEELHRAIQADFGWFNEHLYQFQEEPYSRGWAITDIERNGDGFRQRPLDASKTKVGQFLKEKKLKQFIYLYDFGDDWVHDIIVERIEEDADCSTWLIQGGRGTCPPEDCGGPFRYEYMKKVLREEPDSEEAQDFRERLGLEDGEEFDPDGYVENYIDDLCDAPERDDEDDWDDEDTVDKTDPEAAEDTTLLECMSWLNLGTLEEYAHDMGFEIDLDKDEDGRRKELAAEILSHPRELLGMLPAYDLTLMKQQLQKPTKGHLQQVYKDFVDTIMEMYGLARRQHGKDGEDYIHMPTDLLDAVRPYIDEVIEDKDENFRMDMETLIEGICNMYGRISRTTLKQMLVKLGAGSSEAVSQLLDMLEDNSLSIKRISYGNTIYDDPKSDDDVFYASPYEWDFYNELMKEISKHNDVTPDYRLLNNLDEARLAGQKPIPEVPNAYRDTFMNFLQKELELEKGDALHVCHVLWYQAQHQGEEGSNPPEEYMLDVLDALMIDKDFEPDLYAEAMRQMDCFLNNMPRWQLRGHTPAETGILISDFGHKVKHINNVMSRHLRPADDEPNYMSPYDWLAPNKPFIATKAPGRNDPCPCGSGKKYKKCCGRGN